MTRWAVLFVPLLGLLVVDPTPDYHAVKFVVLLAGCFLGVALALVEAPRVAWSRVSLALWLFVAVRALMLLRSPVPGRALRWWALLLGLVLLHHAACATTPRRWLRRVAPPVLGAAAALLGGYALTQWDARQASATFANRNFAAAGLAMLLPFALAMRGWWRRPAAGLALGGIAATTSRGGLLAAAAGLALWFVWHRPKWRWPVLVGLPVLVLAAGLIAGRTNTVKVRLHWYDAAARLGWSQPLLGAGADGFAREYPPVRPLEEHAISGGDVVHAVHNDYLESWAEGGALGLLAHLFLVYAAARAVRRHRAAAASLLAFGVASLVDLPLRDPSLLALAFVPLALTARRRRARVHPLVPAFAGLVALGALFPEAYWHWRAERTLRAGDVDAALARAPRHPQALLMRGRPDDLRALLALYPHHAGARLNLTRDLPADEARPLLEETLHEHDPHHVLTFYRLAQLRMDDEPLAAVGLLEDALRADPRRVEPYGLLARLYRERGLLEQAERYLEKAESKGYGRDVARERLAFELAELEQQRWAPTRIVRAMRHLPPEECRAPVLRALAAAEEIEAAAPPVKVARAPEEDIAAYVQRLTDAKAAARRAVAAKTLPHYRSALVLADALNQAHPSARNLLLLAKAARGVGDDRRAAQAGALALLADALDATAAGADAFAAGKLAEALRLDPELAGRTMARTLVERFAAAHPDAVPSAKELLRDVAPLRRQLGPPRRG